MWDFLQSTSITKIVTFLGGLSAVGINGISVAALAAGLGVDSVPALAVIAGLAQAGLSAAALATVLGTVLLYGVLADDFYGNQGFDVFFGAGYNVVLPPTIDRQQGIWFANQPFLSKAEKVCDSIESCANVFATNAPMP